MLSSLALSDRRVEIVLAHASGCDYFREILISAVRLRMDVHFNSIYH